MSSKRIMAESVGRLAGRCPTVALADCPYQHDEIDIRAAWCRGFMLGRQDLMSGDLSPINPKPGPTLH